MSSLAVQPAFVAYAVAVLLLTLNLLLLWAYSGFVRVKTRTTLNAEDIQTDSKGARVVDGDPPEVGRVLRAHGNAMGNSLPFALLALVYVLAGGSGTAAWVLFGVFTVARIAHSFAYLGARQPWRTVTFVLGAAITLVLMGFIVHALLAA
jgi:microsomal prostaglandin-E synthase 1